VRRSRARRSPRLGTRLAIGWLALAMAVAAQTGLSVPASAAAPTCPGMGAGTSPVKGLTAQAHPVIVVHGWDGAPMSKTPR
jgi:hypothetical protein